MTARGFALVGLAPGWSFGGDYAVGLAFLGFVVLVGAVATSRQHDRAFSASVLYVGLGCLAAVALPVLGVRPLSPERDGPLLERLTELADLLYATGFALLLGATAGVAAAAVLTRARSRGMLAGHGEGFAAVGFALLLYGATQAVGAYGLLAVFAAGFTFRRREFRHEIHAGMHHGTETVGRVLELLVLLMLGSMLTFPGLGAPGLSGWLLAPLLLLVIRPVLVLASTNPRLMDFRSRVFLGFFGVRGVAAVFYAAAVVNTHALPAAQQHVVVWTTIACVITSIVVHGLTATPLTKVLLGRAP